jgi:hypothetical protein
MSNPCIDVSYQVLVHLAMGVSEEKIKMWKVNKRRTMYTTYNVYMCMCTYIITFVSEGVSNCSIIAGTSYIWWDDDDVHFVLNQHA